MLVGNPFYTIFKMNNWFFSTHTMKVTYSDEIITLDDVYLYIPFKKDSEYNKRLLSYLDNFLENIKAIIQTSLNKEIDIKHNLTINELIPINIKISKLENETLFLHRV